MANTIWKSLLLLIFLINSLSFLQAQKQEDNFIYGDVMVKLKESVDVAEFCNRFQSFEGRPIDLKPNKRLAQSINLWLLQYQPDNVRHHDLLRQIRFDNDVLVAQFNHTNLTLRVTSPDDTQYGSQWDMDNTGQSGGTVDADIDAPEAWDISTGGMTTQGDEIVVAVIDNGFDINHEDLVPNLWKNTAEIAGNGVDDDNNGYIDDVDGWNAYNSNGTITSASHGTHVSGTVGAKGNNAQGVTGVNWDVKVMTIQGSSSIESTVIEAYGYVLDARTLYNTTNGAQGAFVVSTNASFGVDNANPASYPLWCAMYDDLGAQGVISAGATANANTNIDVVGDVPTACASEYMIAVTNTDHNDVKNGGAAYGLTTIDLGAPGTSILSTLPDDTYGNNTGTSMATPHVAGAVGLLVAAACDDFITNYKNNPATYALELRDAIFNGVDQVPSLSPTGSTPTVTGGRLNLYNSILELNPGAGGTCISDFNLSSTNSSVEVCAPTDAVYTIDVGALLGFTDDVMLSVSGNPAGTTANLGATTVTPGNSTTLTIGNIAAAAAGTYTITVSGMSTTGTKTLDLELVIQLNAPTASTLSAPADMSTNVPQSASLTWTAATDATSYLVEIATDAGFGTIVETTNTSNLSYTASTLGLNTMYYWRVTPSNECGDGTVSSVFSFTTIPVTYCSNSGDTTEDEWIEEVTIAGVTNTSGDDSGYGDYTNIVIPVDKGQTYSFSLTPEWTSTIYSEYFRIWIDYNQDGDFFDLDELVFDAGAASTNVETGSFTVPSSAVTGMVGMRIIMQFNSAPSPCTSFTYGEVEDYTLNIIDPNACPTDVVEGTTHGMGTTYVLESDTYIHSTSTIENGADVTYDALDYIELQADFEVQLGAVFLAMIEGCGGTVTIKEEDNTEN